MKVLLIGNGAREHAIAEKIVDNKSNELFSFMSANNPGIRNLSGEVSLSNLKNFGALSKFAERIKPELAIIGPEDPIANGAVDLLKERGIKTFAPTKSLGRLESSKSFARYLLEKYGIEGNPKFKNFTSKNGILEFIDELGEDNFVVKFDGLMGGKGVKVAGEHLDSKEEGIYYAEECLKEAEKVVIEEKLVGEEFSLMSFSDGNMISSMPAIQDHKRAYDGDQGPQTGGMGTISFSDHSLPFLRQEDIEKAKEINLEVMKALEKETGEKYVGVLYGGFMAVKDGIRLIEYNARFGDPEAMNTIPILKNDLSEVLLACANNDLKSIGNIEFEKKATVCKYLVPEGYPISPKKDQEVVIGSIPENCKIYFANVEERDGKIFTGTSRAIGVVGITENFEEASRIANEGIENISGPLFYRKDIGTKELVQKRVENMERVRGV